MVEWPMIARFRCMGIDYLKRFLMAVSLIRLIISKFILSFLIGLFSPDFFMVSWSLSEA